MNKKTKIIKNQNQLLKQTQQNHSWKADGWNVLVHMTAKKRLYGHFLNHGLSMAWLKLKPKEQGQAQTQEKRQAWAQAKAMVLKTA